MMKEIKRINRKIWYGIGAFVIICFIVIGISFKINTDAQKEETLQGQGIHTQANVIAYMLSQDIYGKDYIRATLNLDKNYLNRYFFLLKYKLINEINDLNKYLDVKEGIDIRIKKVIYKVHTYQELIDNIKTKRFTYNKLMFLHIFFNVLKEDNNKPLNYIRILGFNQKGRLYLKTIKNDLTIPLITNYKDIDDYVLKFELKVTLLYLQIINKEELIKEELKSIPIKVDY